MDRLPTPDPSRAVRLVRTAVPALLGALLLVAAAAGDAAAGHHVPFAARAGLAAAESAAQVWASDATLVYVENDEDVNEAGLTPRWAYLFYSESRQKSRGYSIRDNRIVVAADLDMKFEAPPVSPRWIDSEAALQAADAHGGRAYCRDHAGRASSLLLARGPFQQGEPDATTWTIVYTSPCAPGSSRAHCSHSP